MNPHGITGANRAWEAGLDHSEFLKWTDAFWMEEPNHPGLEPDGRLISRIRSYKLARAYKNILLAYVAGDKVALAEDLAFNQTIGFAGEYPLQSETLRLGRGRAAYVPGAQFDGTMPPVQPYFAISNLFWKNPKNAKQIVDAVDWASMSSIPVHVSGPDYLVVNLVSQPENRRSMLHLVNYNASRVPLIPSVEVTLGSQHRRVEHQARFSGLVQQTADCLAFRVAAPRHSGVT